MNSRKTTSPAPALVVILLSPRSRSQERVHLQLFELGLPGIELDLGLGLVLGNIPHSGPWVCRAVDRLVRRCSHSAVPTTATELMFRLKLVIGMGRAQPAHALAVDHERRDVGRGWQPNTTEQHLPGRAVRASGTIAVLATVWTPRSPSGASMPCSPRSTLVPKSCSSSTELSVAPRPVGSAGVPRTSSPAPSRSTSSAALSS